MNSNHSTKWNRINVNEPLKDRLYQALNKYFNDYDQVGGKVAKSVKSVYPDGWKQTTNN